MSTEKIILIGGGGHCKACIDVIEATGKYVIEGILDKSDAKGKRVLGYPVLGTDERIDELTFRGYQFLVTLGQIKSAFVRKKIFHKLKSLNSSCPVIISPYAHVSKYAHIGKGTIVMHNSVVNAEAIVGENCILNTGSIIEHETIIGHHCHISTNAVVNGNCIIGNEVFIGSGTVVSNGNKIADNVVVGGSCYIYNGLPEPGIYIDTRDKKKLLP